MYLRCGMASLVMVDASWYSKLPTSLSHPSSALASLMTTSSVGASFLFFAVSFAFCSDKPILVKSGTRSSMDVTGESDFGIKRRSIGGLAHFRRVPDVRDSQQSQFGVGPCVSPHSAPIRSNHQIVAHSVSCPASDNVKNHKVRTSCI